MRWWLVSATVARLLAVGFHQLLVHLKDEMLLQSKLMESACLATNCLRGSCTCWPFARSSHPYLGRSVAEAVAAAVAVAVVVVVEAVAVVVVVVVVAAEEVVVAVESHNTTIARRGLRIPDSGRRRIS